MPEKQRRPQDNPLRGGVGAVYRRAILPCQMRNGLKFRLFCEQLRFRPPDAERGTHRCINMAPRQEASRTGQTDFRGRETELGDIARDPQTSPIRRELGRKRGLG